MLTRERLRELLEYSKETGEFVWKVQRQRVKKDTKAGTPTKLGYVKIVVEGKSYLAHRLAFLYETGEFPVNFVDHKNGKRSDNRWDNLRNATRSQNIWNSEGTVKELPKNVFFCEGKKNPYRVVIYHNNKNNSYGYYSTIEEANKVAIEIRKRLHGEFSVENRTNWE